MYKVNKIKRYELFDDCVFGEKSGEIDQIGEIVCKSEDVSILENKLELMENALVLISKLNPENTINGFNEWGEAQCFNIAQKIADKVLAGEKLKVCKCGHLEVEHYDGEDCGMLEKDNYECKCKKFREKS